MNFDLLKVFHYQHIKQKGRSCSICPVWGWAFWGQFIWSIWKKEQIILLNMLIGFNSKIIQLSKTNNTSKFRPKYEDFEPQKEKNLLCLEKFWSWK